jgi:putative phosphoribosyl transferase
LSWCRRLAAAVIRQAKLAALLDLLAEDEQIDLQTQYLPFDIDLLAERRIQATNWITADSNSRDLPAGYFGASTEAAATLMRLPELTSALAARGGRLDSAGAGSPNVKAPALLMVDGEDVAVAEVNWKALRELQKKLEIVPGAPIC